jgi:hypothetical protein
MIAPWVTEPPDVDVDALIDAEDPYRPPSFDEEPVLRITGNSPDSITEIPHP